MTMPIGQLPSEDLPFFNQAAAEHHGFTREQAVGCQRCARVTTWHKTALCGDCRSYTVPPLTVDQMEALLAGLTRYMEHCHEIPRPQHVLDELDELHALVHDHVERQGYTR